MEEKLAELKNILAEIDGPSSAGRAGLGPADLYAAWRR